MQLNNTIYHKLIPKRTSRKRKSWTVFGPFKRVGERMGAFGRRALLSTFALLSLWALSPYTAQAAKPLRPDEVRYEVKNWRFIYHTGLRVNKQDTSASQGRVKFELETYVSGAQYYPQFWAGQEGHVRLNPVDSTRILMTVEQRGPNGQFSKVFVLDTLLLPEGVRGQEGGVEIYAMDSAAIGKARLFAKQVDRMSRVLEEKPHRDIVQVEDYFDDRRAEGNAAYVEEQYARLFDQWIIHVKASRLNEPAEIRLMAAHERFHLHFGYAMGQPLTHAMDNLHGQFIRRLQKEAGGGRLDETPLARIFLDCPDIDNPRSSDHPWSMPTELYASLAAHLLVRPAAFIQSVKELDGESQAFLAGAARQIILLTRTKDGLSLFGDEAYAWTGLPKPKETASLGAR